MRSKLESEARMGLECIMLIQISWHRCSSTVSCIDSNIRGKEAQSSLYKIVPRSRAACFKDVGTEGLSFTNG